MYDYISAAGPLDPHGLPTVAVVGSVLGLIIILALVEGVIIIILLR